MIYVWAAIAAGLTLGVLIEECRGRGLAWLIAEVPAGHPEFAYLDVDLPADADWSEGDVLVTLAEIEAL